LDEEWNQVDHTVIASHPMPRLEEDDYIDYDLVLDIPDVVMDDSYNGFEGLDVDFDLYHESYIEFDEFQDQSDMDT